jgi:hypothetical protein
VGKKGRIGEELLLEMDVIHTLRLNGSSTRLLSRTKKGTRKRDANLGGCASISASRVGSLAAAEAEAETAAETAAAAGDSSSRVLVGDAPTRGKEGRRRRRC